MDNRFLTERAQHRELFDRLALSINTCMPGVIQSFDPTTQTATITPAIMMVHYEDGTQSAEQMADIQNVPLYFPFATLAGFALTIPVQPGDTCLLIFAQRNIDNWHEHGGVQPPEATIGGRHHDLSDAFALCCAPSLVDVLENYSTTRMELRNRDKSVNVSLGDASLVMNFQNRVITLDEDSLTATDGTNTIDMKSTGLELSGTKLTVNCPVEFKSTATTSAGVELTTHKHVATTQWADTTGPYNQ